MHPASEPLRGGKAGEVSIMNVLAGHDLSKQAKLVHRQIARREALAEVDRSYGWTKTAEYCALAV